LPIAAIPFIVPELKDYVNDYGGMISSSTEAELIAKMKSFEESDSTQLVILTVAIPRWRNNAFFCQTLPFGVS